MSKNLTLNSLLSTVPLRARDELLSFLAFSEREKNATPDRKAAELLVSLSFFNASTFRAN